MAVLNLRGLPKELVARVKSQAALDGKTIVEWVRWVLEAQFNEGQGMDKQGSVSRAEEADDDKSKHVAQNHESAVPDMPNGLGLRECPNCGGRLLENRKLRQRICMDEQCGYREPLR